MTSVRNRFLAFAAVSQLAIATFPALASSQNAAPAGATQTDEAWQIVPQPQSSLVLAPPRPSPSSLPLIADATPITSTPSC